MIGRSTLRQTLRLSSLLSCFFLMACGTGDGDRDSTSSGAFDSDAKAVAEAKVEAEKNLGVDGSKLRALWDKKSIASGWNELVLNEVHSRQDSFEAAQDLEEFCPGYSAASTYQKDSCWLRIVSAMARYESHFRPKETYTEKSGSTSVGLLMMNPDHCPGANTVELLQNAPANIKCAMARMSLLIARDRYLSGPTATRGASAYWSVLRAPYRFEALFLGRRNQILEFTRSYRGFTGRSVKTDTESESEEQTSP